MAHLDQLIDQALSLPLEKRLLLARLLLGSIDAPPGDMSDAEWDAEMKRRISEVEEGRVQTIPWETVREEMRALIACKSG